MALLQKMVTVTTLAFFGGFVAEKVTAAMSLPSFMVVVLWKKCSQQVISFFIFFFSFVFLSI